MSASAQVEAKSSGTAPAKAKSAGITQPAAPKATPKAVSGPPSGSGSDTKTAPTSGVSRAALESAQVLHKPSVLLTESDLASFKVQIVEACSPGHKFSDCLQCWQRCQLNCKPALACKQLLKLASFPICHFLWDRMWNEASPQCSEQAGPCSPRM